VIRFEGVSKTYTTLVTRRKVAALADFSLELNRGEVVGIAGPNGAGKSTLISLLLGFLKPSSGQVSIDGMPARDYVESRGVGYLTELVNVPGNLRVPAALGRIAVLAGIPRHQRTTAVLEVMTRLGLDEHASKRVKQLSKGNLQRLGLGQAMLGDYEVMVLDEPTHGLDPVWTARFRDIVRELRRPDRVVLIASHNLDELEALSDRVAILDRGRLQQVVSAATVTHADVINWRIVFEGQPDVTAMLPGSAPVEGRPGSWRVTMTRAELSRGLGELLRDGAVLVECAPEEGRLSSVFHEAVGR
jgi:ABC-2 type transport system ATP-binding protein